MIPRWQYVDREHLIEILQVALDKVKEFECPHSRAQLLVNLRSAIDGAIACAKEERELDQDETRTQV